MVFSRTGCFGEGGISGRRCGRGHGGPKFLGGIPWEARLGWSWGHSRDIAAVTSLGLKFWDPIPPRIQIPSRDSSPLDASCLPWAFPSSSGLCLVLFRTLGGLEHPNIIPHSRWICVPSLGATGFLGSPSHFSYSSMGPGDQHDSSHCWQLQGNTNPINPIPDESGMIPSLLSTGTRRDWLGFTPKIPG